MTILFGTIPEFALNAAFWGHPDFIGSVSNVGGGDGEEVEVSDLT